MIWLQRLFAWLLRRRLRARGAIEFRMDTCDDRRLMLNILYWDWRKYLDHGEALCWATREWRCMIRRQRSRWKTNQACADLIAMLEEARRPTASASSTSE